MRWMLDPGGPRGRPVFPVGYVRSLPTFVFTLEHTASGALFFLGRGTYLSSYFHYSKDESCPLQWGFNTAIVGLQNTKAG